MLADSYRKLAQTYQALDFWHEQFKRRYEHIADQVPDVNHDRE